MKAILAATGICFFCAAATEAAVVQNGGFEQAPQAPGSLHGQSFDALASGDGSSWDIWSNLPGWTTSSGGGIEIQSNRTLNTIDAQAGTHYVELDSTSNSAMFQMVMLDVGQYNLSFYFSPRTQDSSTNGVAYGIDGLFNGSAGDAGTAAGVGIWSEITHSFDVAEKREYRLAFSAIGRSDSFGGLLDSVSIMPSTPTPVPAPASALLLLSALGATVFAKRAKKG